MILNSSDSPHLQSSYSNYMNPLTNRGQVSRLASSQGPTSSSSYSSRRFLIIGEVFQRASFFRGFERPVSDREFLTPSASSLSSCFREAIVPLPREILYVATSFRDTPYSTLRGHPFSSEATTTPRATTCVCRRLPIIGDLLL